MPVTPTFIHTFHQPGKRWKLKVPSRETNNPIGQHSKFKKKKVKSHSPANSFWDGCASQISASSVHLYCPTSTPCSSPPFYIPSCIFLITCILFTYHFTLAQALLLILHEILSYMYYLILPLITPPLYFSNPVTILHATDVHFIFFAFYLHCSFPKKNLFNTKTSQRFHW